jgi:hypothetical protein
VDIICLQEVLLANLQRQIYRAVKDEYPYILSALDLTVEEESPERACAVGEVEQVDQCSQVQCPGLTGSMLFGCFSIRYTVDLFSPMKLATISMPVHHLALSKHSIFQYFVS